jgi:DNA-directed RNA polymerase subunit RPC12/RpoP
MLYPCPLCGKNREVRQTKKAKPYYICNECGVQVFVRSPSGIQRMRENAPAPINRDSDASADSEAHPKEDGA